MLDISGEKIKKMGARRDARENRSGLSLEEVKDDRGFDTFVSKAILCEIIP
jgi:hypothetical protein